MHYSCTCSFCAHNFTQVDHDVCKIPPDRIILIFIGLGLSDDDYVTFLRRCLLRSVLSLIQLSRKRDNKKWPQQDSIMGILLGFSCFHCVIWSLLSYVCTVTHKRQNFAIKRQQTLVCFVFKGHGQVPITQMSSSPNFLSSNFP